ncbi:3-oxoacyl-[acyl-carrier protein] reductase [Chryseolinea serpens]|uniref:3-oxoacyl-[acyl-carrier protein] reductase n=1 Tax=Chryseolinea serpens TaxID=947013 RepID=A0A1M5WEP3_9BACT|nr:SDR family oxidoreductase [Chryseolinea serpens]SHH85961.1 3-oxoacyl-[acyl-carrier protein] reductase [Chryseolinea serpens]
MNLDLKGKRAMVCGSTQGIGKAAAVELALLGASITLVARNEEALKEVAAQLQTGAGQQHDYIVADFSFPDDLKKKAEAYGAKNTVHILVNNTGGPPAGDALQAEPDDFVKAFSSHLLCNHILVKIVVPGMKQASYGRIINVISTSVKIPIRGLGVSNTVRGAVANWSKTLSVELAPFGITVNNVLPGASMTSRLESIIRTRAEKTGKTYEAVKHEMAAEVPAGRISDPSEIANAIAFLATPAAGYINGINVPVDGGRTGSL